MERITWYSGVQIHEAVEQKSCEPCCDDWKPSATLGRLFALMTGLLQKLIVSTSDAWLSLVLYALVRNVWIFCTVPALLSGLRTSVFAVRSIDDYRIFTFQTIRSAVFAFFEAKNRKNVNELLDRGQQHVTKHSHVRTGLRIATANLRTLSDVAPTRPRGNPQS